MTPYAWSLLFPPSVGLYPVASKFCARSLLEKPEDRQVVYHPVAFDLDDDDDYRIQMCTQLTEDHFYSIHHEMGHVEYDMAYAKHQPSVYRSGANSAFHEAIGDTIGLHASKLVSIVRRHASILASPTHLIRLGFLGREKLTPEYEINFLMRLALEKVAFLPFGYAMDKYRFALFRNEIDREHELNSMWWALRIEHGGIACLLPLLHCTYSSISILSSDVLFGRAYRSMVFLRYLWSKRRR